jgi:hypothetical protein
VSIEVPLSDPHGPTGQLDAAAVANYLSVPLAKLAVALGSTTQHSIRLRIRLPRSPHSLRSNEFWLSYPRWA